MSYSYWKAFQVETKELRGEIVPTSGEHISFNCNTGSAGDLSDPRNFFVTVRGIAYGVHAHFYKWPSGEWGLGKQGQPPSSTFYHELYITRAGIGEKREVSHSARVKVADLLTVELQRWVKDNQAALVEAQQDDTKREIEKREKEIAELESKIKTIKAEITALQQ